MDKTFKAAIASRNILGKNGASRIVLEQAKRFKQLEADVYIYASRCKKDIVPSGVQVKKFHAIHPVKRIRREAFASGFLNFCKKKNIDLSIGNGDTLNQQVLFLHNIVELELKLVYGDENYYKDSTFMLHDKILKEKKFELIVYNSRLMRNYVEDKYGIPKEVGAVIYPGYNPHKFNLENKEDIKKKFAKSHGIRKKHIVGFITSGNLKKRGIDIFFETLSNMPKQMLDNIAFIVVGKEKNFDSYISSYKYISNSIIYLKPVDNVEDIFKAMDIVIHPALIEEFGMVVLESMACGVPVITSKMVGASEILEGRLKSLVMEKPDAKGFLHILTKLITDRNLLNSLSEISSAAAQKYTWDNYFDTLFDIYADKRLIDETLLEKHRRLMRS